MLLKAILPVFLLFSFLYSSPKEEKLNKVLKIVKITDKNLYPLSEKLANIAKQESNNSGDIVYCLISSSLSDNYIKNVIYEMTALGVNTGTQLVFVLQGVMDREFAFRISDISKEFSKMEYGGDFQDRLNFKISPSLFTDFNVSKVPVLMYSEYKGSVYPDKKLIKYITRGEIMPHKLFELISKKEKEYEQYEKIISSSF